MSRHNLLHHHLQQKYGHDVFSLASEFILTYKNILCELVILLK